MMHVVFFWKSDTKITLFIRLSHVQPTTTRKFLPKLIYQWKGNCELKYDGSNSSPMIKKFWIEKL